ncbi:MAG TPA: lysozyme inhibitor LprI family protein [Bryobacteraceae bacterium]|nr:lysozyme inhibitor LprI family protein [Bryobacteraceae bacterium]
MSVRSALLMVALLAGSLDLSAANPAAPKSSRCAQAKTQLALTSCWANLAKDADKRLDVRSKELASKLEQIRDSALTSSFQGTQEKWQAYRDSHCSSVESLYGGGSMAPMQGSICRLRLSEAREAELKSVLADMAGLASPSK